MPPAPASRRSRHLALVVLLGAGVAAAEPLEDIIESGARSVQGGQQAQAGIDRLHEDTLALADEYRALRRQIDGLAAYNARLERQTANQQQRLAEIDQASSEAAVLAREMVPLLLRMIDSLDTFVGLDKPFRLAERKARIAALRAGLDRAEVSLAASFSAVLDAYLMELGYGDGLSVHAAEIETADARRTVDVLQVGRLALFAQSEDGSISWMWDEGAHAWEPVTDGASAEAVRQGIRMARGEQPPRLLRLPLPAPTESVP